MFQPLCFKILSTRIYQLIYILCGGLIFALLAGCGYVPSAIYAQKTLGESVYVELKVNLPNPENSVELKDLMNKIIIARFQTRIANKEDADSIIIVEVDKIADTTSAISSSAFTTYYRVNTYVKYTYDNKKGSRRTFNALGYYDYNVSLDNPLTTYNNRYYAINQAFTQTVDQFVAQTAFEGQKWKAPTQDEEQEAKNKKSKNKQEQTKDKDEQSIDIQDNQQISSQHIQKRATQNTINNEKKNNGSK